MINLHKYDKLIFNDDKNINKKIKALILLYERDDEKLLTYNFKIRLINHYIKTLIVHEEFETVIIFQKIRQNLLTNYKSTRRGNKFKLLISIYCRFFLRKIF